MISYLTTQLIFNLTKILTRFNLFKMWIPWDDSTFDTTIDKLGSMKSIIHQHNLFHTKSSWSLAIQYKTNYRIGLEVPVHQKTEDYWPFQHISKPLQQAAKMSMSLEQYPIKECFSISIQSREAMVQRLEKWWRIMEVTSIDAKMREQ